ncbi:MAG: hypothetical protein IJ593_11770 [Lachnospiraceae bacterium]|nr:hypothetical protein [Lachnospiraceae bacterium]
MADKLSNLETKTINSLDETIKEIGDTSELDWETAVKLVESDDKTKRYYGYVLYNKVKTDKTEVLISKDGNEFKINSFRHNGNINEVINAIIDDVAARYRVSLTSNDIKWLGVKLVEPGDGSKVITYFACDVNKYSIQTKIDAEKLETVSIRDLTNVRVKNGSLNFVTDLSMMLLEINK